MNDTSVTIVGNALNTPEWRRVASHVLVANFKIASTSRRFDREHAAWVDGSSLRVRVTCWRRLAENVLASVVSGDPLIVTGRLYTRDWLEEGGLHRVSFEMEATAVGHDLARGRGTFERHRHSPMPMADGDSPVPTPGHGGPPERSERSLEADRGSDQPLRSGEPLTTIS